MRPCAGRTGTKPFFASGCGRYRREPRETYPSLAVSENQGRVGALSCHDNSGVHRRCCGRGVAGKAIGWTLLHSLWEGAIIAAVLGAMLLALRTARARYLAACVGLLALLALFTLTLLRLAPQSAQSFPVRDPIVPVWNIVAEDVGSGRSSPNLAVAAPWLALSWMAGVLLMFGRYSVSCICVRRLRRRGICCATEAWQREVERLTALLRISRTVRLLESCLAEVPTPAKRFPARPCCNVTRFSPEHSQI
jgi:hypothetical protein